MRILTALICSIAILSFASCVISGERIKTRIQKYAEVDSLSKKAIPDSFELFFEGQSQPKFAYDKIARITITGGKDDNSGILFSLMTQKAKELYCDALVYVEIGNEKRYYSTYNPFGESINEEITVLEITGLAVRKRISHKIDSITN